MFTFSRKYCRSRFCRTFNCFSRFISNWNWKRLVFTWTNKIAIRLDCLLSTLHWFNVGAYFGNETLSLSLLVGVFLSLSLIRFLLSSLLAAIVVIGKTINAAQFNSKLFLFYHLAGKLFERLTPHVFFLSMLSSVSTRASVECAEGFLKNRSAEYRCYVSLVPILQHSFTFFKYGKCNVHEANLILIFNHGLAAFSQQRFYFRFKALLLFFFSSFMKCYNDFIFIHKIKSDFCVGQNC